MAKQYYEDGKYSKSKTLLESLINVYRGTDKAEEIYYLYTYCHYKERDYILAGYYFNNFAQTYRNSKYTEECMFMTAYCNYLSSPKPSLDQEDTYEAIKNFDLFMSKYPNSSRKDEVERLSKELYAKLQEKAYMSAKQYYNLGNYKAAAVTIKASLKDAPQSVYKEDLLFLDVKAKYDYAENSIKEKQLERFEATVKAYYKFVDSFPESKFVKSAERYFKRADANIKDLKEDEKLQTSL